MPFSDHEPILTEEKSKFKTIVFIVSIALFISSLFNICFCTNNGCRTSIEVLLMGWLAMLTGGAAATWMANPFLIVAWILLVKNRKNAWLFAFIASIISLSFLTFKVIIEDEAGHYNSISSVRLGYWLWLSSCVTTFIGSLTIRIVKSKTYK